MAFKLRSPLHKDTNPFKEQADKIVKRQEQRTKEVTENYTGNKSLFGS